MHCNSQKCKVKNANNIFILTSVRQFQKLLLWKPGKNLDQEQLLYSLTCERSWTYRLCTVFPLDSSLVFLHNLCLDHQRTQVVRTRFYFPLASATLRPLLEAVRKYVCTSVTNYHFFKQRSICNNSWLKDIPHMITGFPLSSHLQQQSIII